ncbi:uncharacterized protein LOC135694778 [Rhopilema esculentum]|uniref:uncharacterized protein LOC135694778 n=1 Tax=Rhopilema esculentum TaxID=499914 RepID=UPI0031DFED62
MNAKVVPKAFSNHIQNKHNNHEDKLFQRCAHGELDHKRRWILNGTTAYDKIQPILMNQSLLQDIAKLSSNAQTSCLEGYHSTLNQWHPKMTHYSWIGSLCRHIMAVSHFNENLHREAQKDKNGKEYFKVSYPKYKLGEEAVKPVPVPPSYNYVEHTKELLFKSNEEELGQIWKSMLISSGVASGYSSYSVNTLGFLRKNINTTHNCNK